MSRLAKIEKVTTLLRPGSVMMASDDLQAWAPANPLVAGGVPPVAVIRPADSEELERLLCWANANEMNLCPVSSSGNHYRGGLAAAEEHLLVDLSGWKGIDWIDRRNRVCLIQPGVTYGELMTALGPRGLTVPVPLAPRSGKSVLAACMDREPSTWPNKQWDIGDPVASTEFYFGNGRRFRTGAAGGPGTLAAQRAVGGAQKCPTGPSQTDFHRVLQGAQGTMGIVTWMTLRAEIKPVLQKPFLLGDRNLEKLASFVYAVQRPGLGEHCFIVNNVCAAMLIGGARDESPAISPSRFPSYICLQNIAGFELLAKSRVAYQEVDIRRKAGQAGLKMESALGRVSAEEFLCLAVRPCGPRDWRRYPRGDCLSVFFLTTLDRAGDFVEAFEKLAARHGFGRDKIGVYIQPVVQNHGCHMEFLVPFDGRSDLSAAAALERESVETLMGLGAFFSRPYLSAGDLVFSRNQINTMVLKKIKEIFDPNRVLNRGKWGL